MYTWRNDSSNHSKGINSHQEWKVLISNMLLNVIWLKFLRGLNIEMFFWVANHFIAESWLGDLIVCKHNCFHSFSCFFFLFFFEECSEVHTFPCASLNKLWHKLLAARRHELKCHPAYAQAPSTHPPNQATPLHPTSTSTLAPLRSVCQSHSGTDTAFVQKQVKERFAASWEGLAPCHTLSRSVSPPGTASWHREGTGTQSWPSCRSSE